MYNRSVGIVVLTCVMTVAAHGYAGTKDTAQKVQTTCPVMGGKIDKAIYVEKDGKRIYSCCKGCVPAIEKDFTKYVAELEKAGVTVEKIQTTCPVMDGRKIDKSLYVDHNGKRIYVCCKGCVQTVKKDPAKYIAELEKQGITVETIPAEAQEAKAQKDVSGGHQSHNH